MSSKNKTEVKENNHFSLEKKNKGCSFLVFEDWALVYRKKGWQVWVQHDNTSYMPYNGMAFKIKFY